MNSKNKGSSFERKICRALSLWVSDGQRLDCFWRSAISGGRATVHHRKGTSIRQSGDICAVAAEGHILTDTWFIECKHVRNLGLPSFLLSDVGPLARYWAVACEQARNHDKHPMLIAKENNQPTIVIVPNNPLFLGRAKLITKKYVLLLLEDMLKGEVNELAKCAERVTDLRANRARVRAA